MKKILFLLPVVLLFSCEKNDHSQSLNYPAPKKSGQYAELEHYDIPPNAEDILAAMESGNYSIQDKPIDEAIWLLESSVNYKYRYLTGTFDSLSSDSLYTELELVNEAVPAQEIEALYTQLGEHITGNLESSAERMMVTNLSPIHVSDKVLALAINITYAHGYVEQTEGILSSTGNEDLQAGLWLDCNNNPDYAAYAKVANLAYYSYNGTSAVYHYGMNVQQYGTANGYTPLYANELFGNINAKHNGPTSPAYCVSYSDQLHYKDVVISDINSVRNHRDVISVQLRLLNAGSSTNTLIGWGYQNISLGNLAVTSNQPTYQ